MVRPVLLDTNILIDELRSPDKETLWRRLVSQRQNLLISGITLTEIWAGESMNRPENEKKVQTLLKKVSIVPLSPRILKRAGQAMRQDENLYLADALIAATCLVKDLLLVTLNQRHFQYVKELEFYTLN